jgi:methylaspartate ammonia-lyase
MTELEKPEISNEFLKSRIGPPRIVKTDGFERLFSHYTGLEGEELIDYLKDFQTKALEVYTSSFVWLMQIHNYGCIANGGFAALRERRHGDYDEVVKFASQGRKLYVDIGCCCNGPFT